MKLPIKKRPHLSPISYNYLSEERSMAKVLSRTGRVFCSVITREVGQNLGRKQSRKRCGKPVYRRYLCNRTLLTTGCTIPHQPSLTFL